MLVIGRYWRSGKREREQRRRRKRIRWPMKKKKTYRGGLE
jgi:hypothetical protein